MATRSCLPGEIFLDAAIIDPTGAREFPQTKDWAQPSEPDRDMTKANKKRGPYIALRWVLNPALGIPRRPFTVWRRPVSERPSLEDIPNLQLVGTTYSWDGMTEMLRIVIEVDDAVTAEGLSRNGQAPVCKVSGGPGRLVLEGGPMVGMRISDPNAVMWIGALSSTKLADSSGWKAIEVVGLPVPQNLSGSSYYDDSGQGPAGLTTDAVSAAVNRLRSWAPFSGWTPLVGLPSWTAPEPKQLVEEFGAELVADLLGVMAQHPPPGVGQQAKADSPPRPLPQFSQTIGGQPYHFGGGAEIDRSEIVTRPLQVLSLAVASDCWASLALGYGTGAPLGQKSGEEPDYDDFMLTAPWEGFLKVAVPTAVAFPGLAALGVVEKEIKRELAAVVLSPAYREPPATPDPVMPSESHVEGAIWRDAPFTSSVRVEVPRDAAGIREPRASGYSLARFDKPGSGQLRLRERRRAGGWIPLSATIPVLEPGQAPNADSSSLVMHLRDSGVPRPNSGTNTFQYATAATDLFGQWSQWNTAWFDLGPADPQVPAILAVKAGAVPGPDNQDPCRLNVAVDIAWNASERSCRRLKFFVDVRDPNPPPAPIDDPPGLPQPGFAKAEGTIEFDAEGVPIAHSPNMTVIRLQPDNTPVDWNGWQDPNDRRYRVAWTGIALTFAGAREKAVIPYVRATETVAPTRWSSWGHAREMTLAYNPLPPPTPVPLPPDYPLWASLPDAGGISIASVTWWPTGAVRYRVYEATEAALLAACGRPGPVLTQDFGGRMEALFRLHANAANLPALRAAYRKLGDAAVSPPPQPDGSLQFEATLPRGSSLIHCFVVVGVSDTNVVSAWPAPDPITGRNGFLAYAIPRALQSPKPELVARLVAGAPRITAAVSGARHVARAYIRRTNKPVLARQFQTMDAIATVAPDLADWQQRRQVDPAAQQQIVFSDMGAPTGWQWLQYRIVASYDNDLGQAGMAIDSLPSDPFQLLNPPPDPPAVSLIEMVDKRAAARAVVRVFTDAPRRGTAVGDHLVAWTVRVASGEPTRASMAVPAIPLFASLNAMLAAGVPIGFVGSDIYLSIARVNGAALTLTVDVTDPLSRITRKLLDAPAFVAAVVPVISSLSATRRNTLLERGVFVGMNTNAPSGPAAAGWSFLIRYSRADVFGTPWTSRTVNVDQIPTIASVNDAATSGNRKWSIARIRKSGRFAIWIPSVAPLVIAVTLSNGAGRTASRQTSSS